MEANFEVEQFLFSNQVDDASASALRECSPEVQKTVITRGDVSNARNPSAALMVRIKEATASLASGGMPAGAETLDVESFIALHGLDDQCAEMLRSCEPNIQQAVMSRGDLSSARNKSAVLQARIRQVQNGGDGGSGGWGPSNFAAKGWSMGGGGGGKGKGGGWDSWTPSWGGGGGGMMQWGGGGGGWGGPGGMMQQWGGGGGWGGAAGWGGGGGGWEPQPDIHWVKSEKLMMEGLPAEGPVLIYNKAHTVFQSASNLLAELVGDIASTVTVVHDPDWAEFPDIAQALKMMTGEEHCLAVAKSDQHGKWGVGCASGWKGRESAVKLALAVSIAVGTPMFEGLARNNPEFRMLCMSAGLGGGMGGGCMGGGMGGGMGKGMGGGMGGGCGGGQWAKGGGGMAAEAAPFGGLYNPEQPALLSAGGPSAAVTNTPPVHWVMLAADSTLVQQGFPPDGPAIAHDKSFADAFRNSHHILQELIPSANEVVITHDDEWTKFPDVGEALKLAGAEENCFCVVTCPAMGKWAIGIGSGWKGRESAGKLAMALAVAMNSEALGSVMTNYPEFAALCGASGMGDMGSSGPPQKKMKMGGW